MPLPPSDSREELHIRQIDMRGYRRPDGLFEIDGRVNDRKTYLFNPVSGGRLVKPGDFIHDMWVRLVVDLDLVVIDVQAVSDSTPYRECVQAGPTLKKIIGARIQAGWSREVKKRLGGAASCTHLMELLIPMATAAYQTIGAAKPERTDERDASGRPLKIDTCFAYAGESEVVARRWPEYHTGPRKVIPLVSEPS